MGIEQQTNCDPRLKQTRTKHVPVSRTPARRPPRRCRRPASAEISSHQAEHRRPLQFQLSGLFPNATVKLAQLGNAGIVLPTQAGPVPGAEDLAETLDTQLTPAIRAKAQELGKQPLAIHLWVKNSIDFVPSYGSMQGADLTLNTRRGNAFDIAGDKGSASN